VIEILKPKPTTHAGFRTIYLCLYSFLAIFFFFVTVA
jgi:hypothetical protein